MGLPKCPNCQGKSFCGGLCVLLFGFCSQVCQSRWDQKRIDRLFRNLEIKEAPLDGPEEGKETEQDD